MLAKIVDITASVSEWFREMILIPFLVSFNLWIYRQKRAASIVELEDLERLSLEGVRRILIIAPHPDDETLGAAGLIQAAREMGIDVKVVMMTNGEGQRLGPIALTRRIRLHHDDFIALGERRQLETVAALKQLGVSSECISFLGYPDRGLYQLWLNDWRDEIPLRSTYTRTDSSSYPATYNPRSVYLGQHIMKDIKTIIADYQPDFIVLPHPNDEHPDHRAATNFVRMVVGLYSLEKPDFQPQMWAYLIHYGTYPQQVRNVRSTALLPPIRLSSQQNRWARLDLDANQVHNKNLAIHHHASQVLLLGNFLPSFARKNELFATLPTITLSPIALSLVSLLETGVKEQPLINGLASKRNRRWKLGGADLLGWRVARIGDSLYLTVDTRGQIMSRLRYRILLKLSDGSTHTVTPKDPQVTAKSTSLTVKMNLDGIPNPPLLAFSAEVSQRVTLDQTGWFFLHLQGWLD